MLCCSVLTKLDSLPSKSPPFVLAIAQVAFQPALRAASEQRRQPQNKHFWYVGSKWQCLTCMPQGIQYAG
eukprot:1643045-Amphidinium_carterae.1